MVHTLRTGPQRLSGGLFAVPDLLLVIGFVALVIVTAIELVLLLAPMLLDPPWVPMPTIVPEPFVHGA